MSEEQQESVEQMELQQTELQMTDGPGEAGERASAPKKKRVVKKVLKIDEQAISPHPSYWPIVLALALVVLFMGVITNIVVILGIGVVLVIIAILGWSFERR